MHLHHTNIFHSRNLHYVNELQLNVNPFTNCITWYLGLNCFIWNIIYKMNMYTYLYNCSLKVPPTIFMQSVASCFHHRWQNNSSLWGAPCSISWIMPGLWALRINENVTLGSLLVKMVILFLHYSVHRKCHCYSVYSHMVSAMKSKVSENHTKMPIPLFQTICSRMTRRRLGRLYLLLPHGERRL